jgi:hypothetical protein
VLKESAYEFLMYMYFCIVSFLKGGAPNGIPDIYIAVKTDPLFRLYLSSIPFMNPRDSLTIVIRKVDRELPAENTPQRAWHPNCHKTWCLAPKRLPKTVPGTKVRRRRGKFDGAWHLLIAERRGVWINDSNDDWGKSVRKEPTDELVCRGVVCNEAVLWGCEIGLVRDCWQSEKELVQKCFFEMLATRMNRRVISGEVLGNLGLSG